MKASSHIALNPDCAQEWSDFVVNNPASHGRGGIGLALTRHLTQRTAVYAIGLAAGSPIKIGVARRPANRLTALQVSSPKELKFHLVCWLAGGKEAFAIETRCHEKLRASAKHIRGEWFDITPLEAAKAIDGASIDVGCAIVPHTKLLGMFPSARDPLAGLFWPVR